jgi:hypothetical protein
VYRRPSSKYRLKERPFTVLVSSFQSYWQNNGQKGKREVGCKSELVTPTKYASSEEALVRLANHRLGVRLLNLSQSASGALSKRTTPVKSETGHPLFCESETGEVQLALPASRLDLDRFTLAPARDEKSQDPVSILVVLHQSSPSCSE